MRLMESLPLHYLYQARGGRKHHPPLRMSLPLGTVQSRGQGGVCGVWLSDSCKYIQITVKTFEIKRRSLSFSSTHKPPRTTSPAYRKTNNHAYIRMPRLAQKNGDKEPHATRDERSRDNSSTYFVFFLVIHRAILPQSASGYLKNVYQA